MPSAAEFCGQDLRVKCDEDARKTKRRPITRRNGRKMLPVAESHPGCPDGQPIRLICQKRLPLLATNGVSVLADRGNRARRRCGSGGRLEPAVAHVPRSWMPCLGPDRPVGTPDEGPKLAAD